jgi:O-antigen/teichoic acid export membrane protein
MPLGRILGICAVPLGLFLVAIGVVLILEPSLVGGIVFAVLGGDLVLAGVWMLVTGRPRSLPFKAARPDSKPGTGWSVFPDLR